ncbi:DUF4102 domain-containing protein [Luteimonas aestuarii]|uniref:DUF4102 domain-containing protein n=1 Tax=Luteimonas aestuarii TaxID=453837 RepID=A0A4R5TYE0_9GAMM|nr:integrase arm-type DNA-binding domain-containing protein [Luteimonas aestuarii]TDK26254.1 DUF4102 domain-containing protein [Luteimonas aestuarii]
MLTDAAIRALKPKSTLYRVADRDGLCLEVTTRGAKHWRYRYRWAGKGRMISLGSYPVITLGMARDRLLDARRQLATGTDPAQAKRKATRATAEAEHGRFPTFAGAWLEEQKKNVKPRTFDKMTAIVGRDLIPALRQANIATLTTPEAMRALGPIKKRAPHMAIKAVGYLNDMVDYAIKQGVREDGRTLSLKGAVKLPKAISVPSAQTPDALRGVLVTIDRYPNEIVRTALQLIALTVLRPSNIAEARWEHIDTENAVWKIPGEFMKTGEDHLVPLPTQALDLLNKAREWSRKDGWVFPALSRRGTPHLHRDTLSKALRDSGLKGQHVPHGFRASLRTLAREEFGIDIDVLEAQLAHSRGNATEQAYNRAKHLKSRAVVMQRWADWLDQLRRSAGKTINPR